MARVGIYTSTVQLGSGRVLHRYIFQCCICGPIIPDVYVLSTGGSEHLVLIPTLRFLRPARSFEPHPPWSTEAGRDRISGPKVRGLGV
jgi:hypothetical protein